VIALSSWDIFVQKLTPGLSKYWNQITENVSYAQRKDQAMSIFSLRSVDKCHNMSANQLTFRLFKIKIL